jgi:hypothetical protein
MPQAGFTPIITYHSTTGAAVPNAADLSPGELALNIADMKLYAENSSGVVTLLASSAGSSGDVVGPASATDDAVVRFNLTTGKLVQNSGVTISDTDVVSGPTQLNVDNLRLDGNVLSSTNTNGNIELTPNGNGRVTTSALSATSPRVITAINDTNGNELFGVTATGSAVNEFTVANAATGAGPTLSATGSDTNININLTPKGTGIALINATSAIQIPVGTTAERPASPAFGMIRANSTSGEPEWYDTVLSVWQPIRRFVYQVEYLVIAGGGGGGGGEPQFGAGGGGGAGGYRTASGYSLTTQTLYTVTIGAGGAGGTGAANGTQGNNSVFDTITSTGGGFGAPYPTGVSGDGGSGGSGGGGGNSVRPGGNGTSGQGNNGGTGGTYPGQNGGGGGGAGAAGGAGASSGAGGSGTASSITGSSVTRAGGGGGGGGGSNGGSGGGGNGNTQGNDGSAGTANTGGGGGGSKSSGSNQTGGAGGSGIVIIRYFGSQRGTGGTVTSSDGFTIHTFTSSGTYTA